MERINLIRRGAFPQTRMRRNRRHAWTRRMVAEHILSADDLIWPIFVVDGANVSQPVSSMPGVDRLSVDRECGFSCCRVTQALKECVP